MKKLLYVAVTFPICALFGFEKIWLGFSLVYVLTVFNRIGKHSLWEIPMAVLACSIITDVFADYYAEVIKIIIPVSAVIIAWNNPKKLILFFPVCIGAIALKNVYAVSAVWALLWYGGREIIIRRQNYIYYSNIKKKLLQENKSENYIEFS